MARPSQGVHTSINKSDGAVKAGPGVVYWVLVAAGATGGAWQLDDGLDGNGTQLLSGVAQANSQSFLYLDPAIEFGTGIFADIQGSNVKITTGFI